MHVSFKPAGTGDHNTSTQTYINFPIHVETNTILILGIAITSVTVIVILARVNCQSS